MNQTASFFDIGTIMEVCINRRIRLNYK